MARSSKPTNEMLGFVEDEDGALTIDDIVIPPPPVAALSYDVPDKRLIITQLRIKNFKSYAGEVVLGPFNKNFTAVVGPNGSGKSNVIDALLFVFGFRAKQIRSSKASSLIHKSDQHPNINSCSVTVKFATIRENGDSYEIIPGTECVLSRTVFANDASGLYEIDKKRVPLKEVSRTLRHYGIDLEHSRFLILQGEIETISLMQPKGQNENDCGMLEYIEDIIGSNRYIEPINKFQEKVSILDTEKKEKFNALKLVEKERDDLEEPKNKAIEYLRLENRKTLNVNSLFHYKRFTADKELGKILESKKEFQDKLNKFKAEINEIKNSRKALEGDLGKINSDLENHMKDAEKWKERYKALECEDAALKIQISNVKGKISKAGKSLDSAKEEMSKLMAKSKTFENETEELLRNKEKRESEKEIEDQKLQQVMGSWKQTTSKLQEEKEKLEVDEIQKQKVADNLKSEMELLQSELNLLQRTEKKEKEALSSLETSLKGAEISSREEEQALQKERERISKLETDLATILAQISDSQKNEENLTKELKNARMRYEDAKSSLSAFKHQSGMLQAFAREKASGRLTGVYGRLGDLGAIDEKYDVAISTACGQLEHIVTDTLATAQQCVEFLKKNNLGYTTFIPLDKMEKWIRSAHSKIATPENVPRLFDLVRVKDEKVLPAFYYALRDTLVADTLEQATRIGLQGSSRHRVVTLKGELIDLAGTMSGGGGRVSRGRMGQTVVECTHTPEEVARISQEVDAASKAVSQFRNFIVGLQEQISTKTKELSNLKLSVKKRQSNYEAYLENAEMLRRQMQQQKKKIESSLVDENKVAELNERIAEKQKSYQGSAKAAAAIGEKVRMLQGEILKVTKGSLSKSKKNVERLAKEIADIVQSITKSSVNAKTCKRNIKKAEDKINNSQKELETANKEKSKLETKREALVNEGKECCENEAKAQKAVDELKDKRAELRKEFKILEEKEQKIKVEEIDLKQKLKDTEDAESSQRGSIRSYKEKLAKLKLNEVEDDSTEIPTLSAEEIERLSVQRIKSDIELLDVQLEEMKPDISAIVEYKKKEKLYNEKQKDYDEIVQERNKQNMRHDALRDRRYTEFMKGFTAIAKKLKETYQMLTIGGDAELEIVETFDPFQKGIEFSVRPPRKSWKYMRNLSGGEKTLSSLALVFALHYYRATPFYVMDEIDAALDVRNVAIVGYYLKECTKNTQFIIVSLRNIMNELSDHLIGIYKTNNCSKNISIMKASKWKEEDEQAEKT